MILLLSVSVWRVYACVSLRPTPAPPNHSGSFFVCTTHTHTLNVRVTNTRNGHLVAPGASFQLH